MRVVVVNMRAMCLHCSKRLTWSVHAYHCVVPSLPFVNVLLFACSVKKVFTFTDKSNIPVLIVAVGSTHCVVYQNSAVKELLALFDCFLRFYTSLEFFQ